MQLVRLHWYWQLSSWAHHPSSGFLQCKSLAGDLSHVSMAPSLPSTCGVTKYSPEEGLLSKKALKAIVDFSGLVPALMPQLALPLPHTQPDLFTWYWIYGRADCHPPATTQMKASEPINRAILRTTLLKTSLLCIVVTNMRSIC